MWHETIKGKYLRYRSFDSWLRENQRGGRNISNIWSNCLNFINIVLKWISWSLGDGTKIRLGEDPILGMEDNHKLSKGLINHLHEKGISHLFKIKEHNDDMMGGKGWMNANSLNLSPKYYVEWNSFTKSLRTFGIFLCEMDYNLLWTWNTSNGILSSNLAYASIIF